MSDINPQPTKSPDDILDCLARIEPGYVELTHDNGSAHYLIGLAEGFSTASRTSG